MLDFKGKVSVRYLSFHYLELFQDTERLREDYILQRHKCDKKYCIKPVPNIPELTICMIMGLREAITSRATQSLSSTDFNNLRCR